MRILTCAPCSGDYQYIKYLRSTELVGARWHWRHYRSEKGEPFTSYVSYEDSEPRLAEFDNTVRVAAALVSQFECKWPYFTLVYMLLNRSDELYGRLCTMPLEAFSEVRGRAAYAIEARRVQRLAHHALQRLMGLYSLLPRWLVLTYADPHTWLTLNKSKFSAAWITVNSVIVSNVNPLCDTYAYIYWYLFRSLSVCRASAPSGREGREWYHRAFSNFKSSRVAGPDQYDSSCRWACFCVSSIPT